MSRRRQILAVLFGPAAWLVCLQLSFALVPWVCRLPASRARLLLPALGIATMIASATALGLAWQAYRSVAPGPADAPPPDGQTRFLALTGLGSGALFLVAALALIIPTLVLGPCE